MSNDRKDLYTAAERAAISAELDAAGIERAPDGSFTLPERDEAGPGPILLRDNTAVAPGLYIQQGHALYKVSTVYAAENRLTAQVCFDHNGATLGRTTVRHLTREQAEHWKPASTQRMNAYHAHLDRQP